MKKKKKKQAKSRSSATGRDRSARAKLAVIGTTAEKPAKATKVARTVGRGTHPKRVAGILAKLDEAYPAATCELIHENPFQLLISTILSAQCTDVGVNQVTQTPYNNYPHPQPSAHPHPSA